MARGKSCGGPRGIKPDTRMVPRNFEIIPMTAYDAWLPWMYQYGVGGLLTGATLILSLKTGALDLDRKGDKRLMRFLLLGYFGFCALHAIWIFGVYP